MAVPARDSAKPVYRPLGPGESPFWNALVTDTASSVLVITEDGTIEFINPAGARLLNKTPDDIVGHSFASLFEPDYAKERLSLMRDVMSSGDCICVEGMVRGKCFRSTYRPLPPSATSNNRPRVLIVARPVAGAADKDDGTCRTVKARVNDAGPLAVLTSRELEIMRLIGLGLSTNDIAKKLHRSVKTIEWHRVSLGTKLGVTNRVELARLAIAAGMVGLESEANGRGLGE